MIELIKGMWQAVLKMKELRMFVDEVVQIEGVLKMMVIKMARPKL